jgi:hypothetical protein
VSNQHLDYEDLELVKIVTDYVNGKGLNNFKLDSVDIQLIGSLN